MHTRGYMVLWEDLSLTSCVGKGGYSFPHNDKGSTLTHRAVYMVSLAGVKVNHLCFFSLLYATSLLRLPAPTNEPNLPSSPFSLALLETVHFRLSWSFESSWGLETVADFKLTCTVPMSWVCSWFLSKRVHRKLVGNWTSQRKCVGLVCNGTGQKCATIVMTWGCNTIMESTQLISVNEANSKLDQLLKPQHLRHQNLASFTFAPCLLQDFHPANLAEMQSRKSLCQALWCSSPRSCCLLAFGFRHSLNLLLSRPHVSALSLSSCYQQMCFLGDSCSVP